jgi:hypothetical protein
MKNIQVKKTSLIILLLLTSTICRSQVSTQLLTCKPPGTQFRPRPTFSVKFNGADAEATLKGFTHKAKYINTTIDNDGNTWMKYASPVIIIHITPYDNYVLIVGADSGWNISGAFCH